MTFLFAQFLNDDGPAKPSRLAHLFHEITSFVTVGMACQVHYMILLLKCLALGVPIASMQSTRRKQTSI
jgi:hypothetical protein